VDTGCIAILRSVVERPHLRRWGDSMSKTIVICSDGTGNAATSEVKSNVKQLFDMVVQDAHQVATYDDGVGTAPRQRGENPLAYRLNHLAELGFGRGLAQNLLELYTFLIHHYDEGDSVFLFGFSRGAFTVRALAGLVHVCGLLRREHIDKAADAVRLYEGSERRIIVRRREQGLPPAFCAHETDHGAMDPVAQAFKAQYGQPCSIRFLGIWDTVKAYGWIRPRSFPALRHNLSVQCVCHAAALDEHRALFQMTGWADGHAKLQEVWFAGDHADVGGGHKDGNSALTDASLRWMLGEATQSGLRLTADAKCTVDTLTQRSAEALRTPAKSLWLWPPHILLDLFPREELDNVVYPPRRPWRLFWPNGARKPGDHPLRDTVYIHHTLDAKMQAEEKGYSRNRLLRRSDRKSMSVLQLCVVQDRDAPPTAYLSRKE
jgi:uncharacterized protein (DUF2235 family)